MSCLKKGALRRNNLTVSYSVGGPDKGTFSQNRVERGLMPLPADMLPSDAPELISRRARAVLTGTAECREEPNAGLSGKNGVPRHAAAPSARFVGRNASNYSSNPIYKSWTPGFSD